MESQVVADRWRESYEIVHVQTEGWAPLQEALRRHVTARPRWDKPPLSHITEILGSGLECTTAIIQAPYRDEDALHDYMHDYGWSFRDISRYCARIHFFGGQPINKEDFLQDIRRYDSNCDGYNEKQDPYLGYCVVSMTALNRLKRF